MKRGGIYREGFFKVSRRLLDSSLWCEDGDVIKVFMVLVALSQDPGSPRDGSVCIARKMLAAKCFMAETVLDRCLAVLANPDPQSRTPGADGRRVEVLPNGFRVVNYRLYHDQAKDRLLSQARSAAGRIGGTRSAEIKKDQRDGRKQKPSNRGSKFKLLDGDGDGDGDGDKTETQPTDMSPAGDRPEPSEAETLALSERAPSRVVFQHWQSVMGKQLAKLDNKRKRAIEGRLKEGYSVEDLCSAVDGCRDSPWHQGDNDRRKAFRDIELICRDAQHVDDFIDIARRVAVPRTVVVGARAPTSVDAKNTDALREFAERRMRGTQGSGSGAEVHTGAGEDRKGLPPGGGSRDA